MQTANAFSVKWDALKEDPSGPGKMEMFPKGVVPQTYGFEKENNLADFLQDKD